MNSDIETYFYQYEINHARRSYVHKIGMFENRKCRYFLCKELLQR